MKYKVLQKFLTKRSVYMPGEEYTNSTTGKFTKNLLKYGFIEPVEEVDCFAEWENNGIKSKSTGLIIAPENYAEGDKKYFTFDDTLGIEKKLKNGWRLPTRHEWVLLAEELGMDDRGTLNGSVLGKALNLPLAGRVTTDGLDFTGSYGYYWSSTIYSATSAYYLYFLSSSVDPASYGNRYIGRSVRCVKEAE